MTKTGFFSKLLLSSFLLLFFQNLSIAKGKPEEGYIITSHHDTIKGYIDYQYWMKSPGGIPFSTSDDNNYVNYSADSLLGFGLRELRYVSANVEVETSPQELKKLDSNSVMTFKRKDAFLRVIYSGPKSLYYLYDENRTEHFYVKVDTGYILLKHKYYKEQEYYGVSSVRTMKKEVGIYKNQLVAYLDGCERMAPFIEGMSYEVRSMRKLFKKYYACSSENYQYAEAQDYSRYKLGATVGVSSTQVDWTGKTYEYLQEAEYNSSYSFSGGIFCQVNLPNSNNRWSFNSELSYLSVNVDGQMNEGYGLFNSVYDIRFGYTQINSINTLRYRYVKRRNWGLFMDLGLSYGFLLKNTSNEVERYKEYLGYSERSFGEIPYYQRQGELRGVVAGGAEVGRFYGLVRYEPGFGLYALSNTQTISILIGYYFSK